MLVFLPQFPLPIFPPMYPPVISLFFVLRAWVLDGVSPLFFPPYRGWGTVVGFFGGVVFRFFPFFPLFLVSTQLDLNSLTTSTLLKKLCHPRVALRMSSSGGGFLPSLPPTSVVDQTLFPPPHDFLSPPFPIRTPLFWAPVPLFCLTLRGSIKSFLPLPMSLAQPEPLFPHTPTNLFQQSHFSLSFFTLSLS